MSFRDIQASDAVSLLHSEHVLVLDMRDASSFASGHIHSAKLVDDPTILRLIRSKDYDKPILVYCYLGNSSKDMANFLAARGFRSVFNLGGGWQAWQSYQANM